MVICRVVPASDRSGRAHPFTAPEERREITNLRKIKTRIPMGTTATTLAARMVVYGTAEVLTAL
jgi:hypothetical protein